MYTRAFSTLGCGELDLDGVMALAARHGVTQLELRALGGTIQLLAELKKHGSPEVVAQAVSRAGMRIVSLDTSFRLMGGTAENRNELREFLPWAKALGVSWLRIFDGGRALDAASLAGAADVLQWWKDQCQEGPGRTELMIETHDQLFSAETIAQFVEAMPDGTVHLLWDTHHTWKRGNEDPVVTWKAIAPLVVHVHVKDSIRGPDANHPVTYVLPGRGDFPMAPLRSRLAAGFTGPVSLEWERFWHPELPPLDDALRSAAEHSWW
jgi:sugar phosphate isomerase/epimerase